MVLVISFTLYICVSIFLRLKEKYRNQLYPYSSKRTGQKLLKYSVGQLSPNIDQLTQATIKKPLCAERTTCSLNTSYAEICYSSRVPDR